MANNIYGASKKTSSKATTKVTLVKKSGRLYTGQKLKLKIKRADSSVKYKNIKWTSSNKRVATVSKHGTVKAKRTGTTTIKCIITWKSNKKTTIKKTIKIYKGVKLMKYKLSNTSINLTPGKSQTIKALFTPTNATVTNTAYVSNNTKVATVDKNGKITGKRAGTAQITCTVKTYNNKTYKRVCTVKVSVPASAVTLNMTKATMPAGHRITLKATVAPSNATNKSVKYLSLSPSIAKVDKNGVVTGLKEGTAVISVTAHNGKKAVCTVTVTPAEVDIALETNSIQLKMFTTDNANATVTGRMQGVASSNKYLSSVDGVLYNKKKSTLKLCPMGKKGTLKIPSGTKNIDSFAFDGCSRLTAVVIPDSVKNIEILNFIDMSEKFYIICNKGSEACTYAKDMELPYRYNFASVNVKLSTEVKYTGANRRPSVTVKSGSKVLKRGVDYTVSYVNNKNIGKARVIIKGKGKYAGTVKKTFKIEPGRTTSLKQSKTTYTSKIKLTWNKVKGATGYEVYRATAKDGKYRKIKTLKSKSFTDSSLESGTNYYYKVRAYKKVSGKKVYGTYSKVVTMKTK